MEEMYKNVLDIAGGDPVNYKQGQTVHKNRKTNRNEIVTHTSKQTHRHIHPSRQTDTYIKADTLTHTSKQTHRHIHPSRHI